MDRDVGEGLSMGGSSRGGPPLDGEHYRELAQRLRELARQCRFPGARRELLDLAANYERRADQIEGRAR
jgi:hypothetical protein